MSAPMRRSAPPAAILLAVRADDLHRRAHRVNRDAEQDYKRLDRRLR